MEALLRPGIVRLEGWEIDQFGTEPGVPWPVAYPRLASVSCAIRRYLLTQLDRPVGDRATDALRLAAHRFSVYAAAVAEAAFAVAAEKETGLRLCGVPEIEALRTDAAVCSAKSTLAPLASENGGPSGGLVRRLARVASWSPLSRLPQAWLSPQAVAVTHNGLLREAAKQHGAVGFRHADEWLNNARQKHRSIRSAEPARVLAGEVARKLAALLEVDPAVETRAERLFATALAALMETAWADLRALEQTDMPDTIWSGTGGFWPARAIGIETMRRRGKVRRFDHGGGLSLVADRDSSRLIELEVSSEFVSATEAQASILRRQIGNGPGPVILAGNGDPHYWRSAGPARQRKRRPRVMYVGTATLGFRHLWPLKFPDFVYLDWQMRVARALSKLDLDLVLKPHPDGLYRGLPHPVSRFGPVENRPFEDVLDDVDVVIFDYPASTTFCAALISRCPIVLFDCGFAEFDPMIAPAIANRVTTIPVKVDEYNRPQFENAALADAVRSWRSFDHVPFRVFFGGERAAA